MHNSRFFTCNSPIDSYRKFLQQQFQYQQLPNVFAIAISISIVTESYPQHQQRYNSNSIAIVSITIEFFFSIQYYCAPLAHPRHFGPVMLSNVFHYIVSTVLPLLVYYSNLLPNYLVRSRTPEGEEVNSTYILAKKSSPSAGSPTRAILSLLCSAMFSPIQ